MFGSVLFAACFGLFLAHSYRELLKYFSGWTATAFHTEVDADFKHPLVAVCPKIGFRTSELIWTAEDYERNTWTFSEIFDNETFSAYATPVGSAYTVRVVNTMWYGKCYVIEMKLMEYDMWTTIKVR